MRIDKYNRLTGRWSNTPVSEGSMIADGASRSGGEGGKVTIKIRVGTDPRHENVRLTAALTYQEAFELRESLTNQLNNCVERGWV